MTLARHTPLHARGPRSATAAARPTSAPLSRRRFLLTGTAAAAGTFTFAVRAQPAPPKAEVLHRRVISRQPHYYHGWPTLARRKNGELWLVYSGGREAHVCPFGRVEAMKSRDNGENWTWPRVLRDSDIDDRDAGVLETANGTLLVTSFTSLAFEPILAAAERRGPAEQQGWPEQRLAAWKAARDRLAPEQRNAMLGVWMLRSTDGGMTWSAPYRCLVNSPHGPIQLQDGRVLYAGKALWDSPPRVGVCESTDDGESWRWLAEIPERPGDRSKNYHELHAVETRSGRLLVHIRNHNPQNNLEILQSESSDGGKTWSTPHPIGVWGLPSHLLRLRDGRLLMSYGHRRPPFGNQARISVDEGRTWSAPIIISDDGRGGDLGYPSTVELDDGSLLTVWYELMAQPRGRAVLRQARWRIA